MSTEARIAAFAIATLLAGGAGAADVEFNPRVTLETYRAGNVLVTDETGTGRRISDEAARLGVDLDVAIRNPASSWNLSFNPATTRHNDRSELDNTSYRLAAEHARTLSPRASLSFGASAERTEDQGVREETVGDAITLLPRSRIDRYTASIGGSLQAGPRSAIDWGVNAGSVRRNAEAGVVLLDDDRLGAQFGWLMTATQRASYGLGAAFEFYDYSSGVDTRVVSLGFLGDFTLSRDMTVGFSIGAGRSSSGASDDVRLAADARLTRAVGERSSLSAGMRQGISPGTGLSHATEDRGIFASWRYSQPRGVNAGILLGWWENETLGFGGDAAGAGTRTVSTRETIGWAFGPRFTLAASHSFRRQRARGTGAPGGLAAEPYHDVGLVVVWNLKGR